MQDQNKREKNEKNAAAAAAARSRGTKLSEVNGTRKKERQQGAPRNS